MALAKNKAEYLKKCQYEIKRAKKYREDRGLDKLWDDLLNLYRGKHWPDDLTNNDKITINLAFSTINVIHPAVSISHPQITVNARKAEDEDRAVIVEAVINYWWGVKNIHPEFGLAVLDYLIFGFGWLKTGYRFVEESRKRPYEDVRAEAEAGLSEAMDFAMENPDLADSLPSDEEIESSITDTEMVVVEDTPFGERISPADIYVDPDGTTMRDIRWIAQKLTKTLDEAQNDERYKPSARKHLKAGESDKYCPTDVGRKDEKSSKRVVIWEYYDLKRGQMCVFADDSDEYLVDPMEMPYAFGHPFLMIRNYEVPDEFYPMGELEQIEALQYELNKTRTQIMNDRKRYSRKYIYDQRAFSPQAAAILESQRDGAFVPVNDGVQINEAVIPLAQTPLDGSIYNQSEMIEADIFNITAISEYARGGGAQAVRRTATEASIIQDAANARSAFKMATVESFIADIARNLVALSQQYLTTEQVARIEGRNGFPVWVQFERSWLKGEFDFQVEGGSTKPLNEFARREQAMQVLQALGPFMDPSLGLVNVPEVLRHVLKTGFGIKNPGRFLGPGASHPPGLGMPPGEGGGPQPPPDPAGQPPQGGEMPVQGALPPELLAQIENQMGTVLPNTGPTPYALGGAE